MPTQPADPDLRDFLDDCGWAASTLVNATSILRRYERHLADTGVELWQADHRTLKGYLAHLEQHGAGPAYRHKHWQMIRALYAWAARPIGGHPDARRGTPAARPGAGILTADPMLRAHEPQVPTTPTLRYATEADVATLEAHFLTLSRLRRGGGETERHLRNAAMVSLMFRGGCRASDLPGIDLAHLVRDDTGQIIYCRVGGDDGLATKNRTARLVPIIDETPALIERYLRRRGQAPGPLFVGRHAHTAALDDRLTSTAIRRVVRRAAQACGIVISSHDMRRAWAVNSNRRGISNLAIRRAAGWRSDKSLERYLGPQADVLAVEAFHAAAATAAGAQPRRLRAVQ